MVRETAYDTVFDAQRHFRALLTSMSRPGTISELEQPACTPPAGLNRASALVAFALLNADVSFQLVNMNDEATAYLAANTGASPAPVDEATFVFVSGQESPDALDEVNCGSLSYPDTSATIVIQVEALSRAQIAGALRLDLQGPGVEGTTSVYVRPLSIDLLLALQARNAEFPLGIDAIVTCDAGTPRVMGIPRTAKVSWDAC